MFEPSHSLHLVLNTVNIRMKNVRREEQTSAETRLWDTLRQKEICDIARYMYVLKVMIEERVVKV
jgi:hypothetical protein